jgi:hypothetical protein
MKTLIVAKNWITCKIHSFKTQGAQTNERNIPFHEKTIFIGVLMDKTMTGVDLHKKIRMI